ncbi:unnamed protein product [Cuscuta campestris]|uniref:Protein kinase domain-containing protein n=2 Tax=Cuscuta sect. Cleistogrammica TaxID=1824901 RepID=A0A484KI46_9ASTE|nr:hypothetical protein DM860_009384 [Cuscuta australis]VFQ61752.1 unnamed protein product [Cuscuta campestris]
MGKQGFFAPREDAYTPLQVIRATSGAVMAKSCVKPFEYPVQILVTAAGNELERAATELASVCLHRNILGVHVSFQSDSNKNQRWTVMPSVSRVPLKSLLAASPSPLPESGVGLLLRETLEGLEWLHRVGGEAHGGVCADNVYMDAEQFWMPKLGFRELMCRKKKNTAECWAAPERVHGKAADVWAFGLFALELVYGGEIPASTYADLRRLLEDNFVGPKTTWFPTSWNRLLLFKNKKNKKEMVRISESLGYLIRDCLREDPRERPSSTQLLQEHPYFLGGSINGGSRKEVKEVLANQFKKAEGRARY